MNCFGKSKKVFKRIMKANKEMMKVEWHKFAQDNYLFSANTLLLLVEARSFEDLKEILS